MEDVIGMAELIGMELGNLLGQVSIAWVGNKVNLFASDAGHRFKIFVWNGNVDLAKPPSPLVARLQAMVQPLEIIPVGTYKNIDCH
jgi:hypothetical protein